LLLDGQTKFKSSAEFSGIEVPASMKRGLKLVASEFPWRTSRLGGSKAFIPAVQKQNK
jgi:hypothetical protein